MLSRMLKRERRALGDRFGLKNFGVNLTRLFPGGESALLHRHSKQDEFIYILQGEPTLVTDAGEISLRPGMCGGFPAAGRRTSSSTAPLSTSCILKLVTVLPATRASIRSTIFRRRSMPRGNGCLPARTALSTQIRFRRSPPHLGAVRFAPYDPLARNMLTGGAVIYGALSLVPASDTRLILSVRNAGPA